MTPRRDKRPGNSENDGNLSSSKRPRRFLELYRQLEDPDFHDAFILVLDLQNGLEIKLKVHKAMVLAASEVLRTQFSSRWDPLNDPVIQLPEEYSVQAATTFIKLLYMDFIDADISVETVLQIVSLCDMYMIEDAMDICNDFITTKIEKDNCLLIHETYEKIHVGNSSIVINTTLRTIAENIKNLIASPSAAESWSESTWRTVLSLESPHIVEMGEYLELKLFQQLLRWRKVNVKERNEKFHNVLLPLIRFPLMKSTTLADKVVPTGILSEKDIADLFCFNSQSSGVKSQGKSLPRFPRYSRAQKLARNTDELTKLLDSAIPYSNILLSPGDFSSSFELNQDNIKISGSGNLETRLICGDGSKHDAGDLILFATTSDSTFTNLQFICVCPKEEENEKKDGGQEDDVMQHITLSIEGSRNEIYKVETDSCTISICGNFNSVSHSTLKNNYAAIRIGSGKRNVIKNLSILSAKFGIVLYSGYNIVEDVEIENVETGIQSQNADYGEFRNVTVKLDRQNPVVGILIWGGSCNKISGVNCSCIHPFGEDDKYTKTTGIVLRGKGWENEITDFLGNLLGTGLRILRGSEENVVKSFKTLDTLTTVQITGSEENYGNNIECKYSADFFKKAGKSVVALKMKNGKENVFDDVHVIIENNVGDESEDNEELISKFLQNPNLVEGGTTNVIRFRNFNT